MQKIGLSELAASLGWIASVHEDIKLFGIFAKEIGVSDDRFSIIEEEYYKLIGSLEYMITLSETLRLNVTPEVAKDGLNAAKRAIFASDRESGIRGVRFNILDLGILRSSLRDIVMAIEKELRGRRSYSLEPAILPYYDALGMFSETLDKFPASSREDIEHAGKCIAFGEGTAAVFHLMRAMEAIVSGIVALGGLSANPDKEWGKLLSDIGRHTESLPQSNPQEKALRNRWSACHKNLYHVKQAVRNDTMHPKQTYTTEEAKQVFDSTRAFVRELATLI
ncbi:hypothetical protein [Sphingomonas baiyangensis]|uniref:Uncharacterized protein n=1 Tax=Sphingomonas baiyangensis TaxID=2572576 RepID=A0A4V5PTH3_9SPHN|nr:hypothetical protein [Sphingomonas baiyangensis]TKD50058.1 hypothetical protein FBR43_04280 [Sphingomonas baiyangensis]